MYGEEECLKNHRNKTCCPFLVFYEQHKRLFYFSSVSSESLIHRFYQKEPKAYRIIFNEIFYCQWCGAKLPKSLAREWFDIVTKKFGVTDICNKKKLAKKLPPEFFTEQWWCEWGL
jgi:hypothetical protein